MLIMITTPKPSITVLNQIIKVQDEIDGVILRFDAPDKEIINFIHLLKQNIPMNKIIVHNNPAILFACGLKRIHFKDTSVDLDTFMDAYPKIHVSQSVHSLETAKRAEAIQLSFILFGHVFPTPSKLNVPTRDSTLIDAITQLNIPVIALGGINETTIKSLHPRFSGFAGIRLFTNQQALLAVKKEWLLRTTSL